MATFRIDVGTYGAEMGGLMAAMAVNDRGLDSVVLGWSPALGGMTLGGLGGAMDYIREPHRSALTKEFYERVTNIWLAENPDWASKPAGYWDWDVADYLSKGRILFAPKHGRQALREMLASRPGIKIVRNIWIDHVDQESNPNEVAVHLTNGDVYIAPAWHDASYEGHLARKMGVTWDSGRDGVRTYGEEAAGTRAGNVPYSTDVLDTKGNLWPHVACMPSQVPVGSPDRSTMVYVYRMTISKHANRLPFTPPPNFRRADFLWFIDQAKGYKKFESVSSYKRINEHLYGTNGPAIPVLSWGYPELMDREALLEVWRRVQYIQRGMYWIMLQDPEMTPELRADTALHGLPHDDNQAEGDYFGTPGWSSQLYVRESGHMVHEDMILTRNVVDDAVAMSLPDPIDLHGYGMDSHQCRQFPVVDGTSNREGHMEIAGEGLYQIGLANVKAPKGQAPRLVVSWGFAQSRNVLCSSRIEPPYQQQGEHCGVIAAISAETGIPIADLPYSLVRPELDKRGAYLTGVR